VHAKSASALPYKSMDWTQVTITFQQKGCHGQSSRKDALDNIVPCLMPIYYVASMACWSTGRRHDMRTCRMAKAHGVITLQWKGRHCQNSTVPDAVLLRCIKGLLINGKIACHV